MLLVQTSNLSCGLMFYSPLRVKFISSSRFTIYDLRFTIHDLRFTIYDLRFTIHDSRFTIYDLRFTIHDSRFTIHDLRFTIYDLRFTIYSDRNASIGSRRAARHAGQRPLITPTIDDTPTPKTADQMLNSKGKPMASAINQAV